MNERCPNCDKPNGWDAMRSGTLHDVDGCECDACVAHCWGSRQCDPVDWRARALAAEARLEAGIAATKRHLHVRGVNLAFTFEDGQTFAASAILAALEASDE